MLGSGYIKINNNEHTPSTFNYALQPDEKIFKSAAGTELVNIVRLDKHVFTMTWEGVEAELVDEIEGYCTSPTVTLTYRSNDYICRMRGLAPQLLNKAYKFRRSDGLWNISVTATEL